MRSGADQGRACRDPARVPRNSSPNLRRSLDHVHERHVPTRSLPDWLRQPTSVLWVTSNTTDSRNRNKSNTIWSLTLTLRYQSTIRNQATNYNGTQNCSQQKEHVTATENVHQKEVPQHTTAMRRKVEADLRFQQWLKQPSVL